MTWRRNNGALVRELEFRDYDEAKDVAAFIAEHVEDYHRHPDLVITLNRLRIVIAKPAPRRHHARRGAPRRQGRRSASDASPGVAGAEDQVGLRRPLRAGRVLRQRTGRVGPRLHDRVADAPLRLDLVVARE